jgi:cytochrome c oxidase subunit 2
MRMSGWAARIGGVLLAAGCAGAVLAQEAVERVGKPVHQGLHFQPAASEIGRDIHFLDWFLIAIIVPIVVLVLALLVIVILRFRAEKNPSPARFTHNSPLEVAWTLGPVVILVVIGSVSLPILFRELDHPTPDVTIKVTGNQWFWSYEYPDEQIGFDAFMIGSPATGGDYRLDEATRAALTAAGYKEDEFLLATDNQVVVPLDKVVRLQITATDVIHSWTIQSFGVKMDAVPGRLNEAWFRAEIPGLYFGQCSELCGKDHAFMPIVVKVVSEEEYAAWLETAKQTMSTAGVAPPPAAIALAAN